MGKKLEGNMDLKAIQLKKGELLQEVEDLCGENLFGCYQCGTCTAGCPFIDEMDLSPDEVIRFVILDRKEVLNSKTIWLCASCFTCAERCPRDINITSLKDSTFYTDFPGYWAENAFKIKIKGGVVNLPPFISEGGEMLPLLRFRRTFVQKLSKIEYLKLDFKVNFHMM